MRNGAHGDSIGDRSGKHGQKLTGTARFWGILGVSHYGHENWATNFSGTLAPSI